jgi:hypothetical protein
VDRLLCQPHFLGNYFALSLSYLHLTYVRLTRSKFNLKLKLIYFCALNGKIQTFKVLLGQ